MANAYIFTGRNGRKEYFYQSGVREAPNGVSAVVKCAFVSVFFLPVIFLLLFVGLFFPVKTDLSTYDHTVVVSDTTGFLDDAQPLKASLESFRDKTGVTPSVEIVRDSDWKTNYTDRGTFAYSEYLRLFDDEKHWLFIVSYPEEKRTDGFVDWEWEGMIGDEVGRTIKWTTEDELTEEMHRQLLRTEPEQIGSALAKVFDTIGEKAMKPQFTPFVLVAAAVVTVVYVFIMWLIIHFYRRKKKVFEAQPAPSASCPYCGCRVFPDVEKVCTRCGAPVTAQEQQA